MYDPGSAAASIPDNDSSRLAYGIGFDLGQRASTGLASDGLTMDPALLTRGFSDATHGLPPALPPQEMARVMRATHRLMIDRAAQRLMAEDTEFRTIAEQNLRRSDAAIAAFAAQPGVQAFAEGVRYIVVASGNGRGAVEGEVVVADFVITGSDGREIARGQSTSIDPEALLPGMATLLRQMKPGDHWKIAIPPAAAYGLGGDPPRIGPNEAIFADVTILRVAKKEGGS